MQKMNQIVLNIQVIHTKATLVRDNHTPHNNGVQLTINYLPHHNTHYAMPEKSYCWSIFNSEAKEKLLLYPPPTRLALLVATKQFSKELYKE